MTEQLIIDVNHYLKSSSLKNLGIIEELLKNINKAYHDNPYRKKDENHNYYDMWNEQCGINYPLFYLSSIYLYYYSINKNIDTFLFASRDCCHWVKIFKKMFINLNSHYFQASRNMLETATLLDNPHYNTYVKSLIKTDVNHTVYVDIHGTAKRAFDFFKEKFNEESPYCFLLSATLRSYAEFPEISRRQHEKGKLINLVFDARGSPIEMLNYDVIGTLQTYNETGSVRDKLEYSMKYLEPYHISMDYICHNTTDITKTLDKIPLNSRNDVMIEIHNLIRKIYRVIQDNKPCISEYIKHPCRHPKSKEIEKNYNSLLKSKKNKKK